MNVHLYLFYDSLFLLNLNSSPALSFYDTENKNLFSSNMFNMFSLFTHVNTLYFKFMINYNGDKNGIDVCIDVFSALLVCVYDFFIIH